MATENNPTPQPRQDEPDDLDLDLSQLDERKTNSRKVVSIVAGLSIIVLLVIAVPLFLKFMVFAPKEDQGVPVAKDEALQGTQQQDNSIAAMQKRMEQDKEQKARLLAQQLADQERQKAELERRRQEAMERKRQLEEAMRNQQTAEQQAQPGSARGGRQGDQPLSPSERKLMGQVMVNLGGEDKAARTENASNNSLNTMLESEEFASASATMQTIDPRYLLIRGSQIPCVLKTKIVTDYQGPVMCVVDKDIYSDDVSNLLIRRGSVVHGQRTQVITQGAARVFINWGSIDTPEHVRINVNALGTDTLGAAGAPAWMDTHFWQRFGNTLKLMTFSDLLETGKNVASQNQGTNNGYISYDNTTDGVESLANTTLQKDINIPDTGYINQGTLMNIYVPRDVDFSSVYHDQ
ncbi:TrbI/VirB10 family protein [Escherichia coli]